jgi:hypothetical protein
MLSDQETEGKLEHLDEEWKNTEAFSKEDLEFFNEERDDSQSGWKRMDGVFTDKEVNQFKEPGKEYLRRYLDEDEQGRELFTVFWREKGHPARNNGAGLTDEEFEEKLGEFDEEWENTPPAEKGEAYPEDLDEENRQAEESL